MRNHFYLINEMIRHVRDWALPGTKGLGHRIGGLEKEANTGNVSYDPANHEYMVKIREAKVDEIANHIPLQGTGSRSGKGRLAHIGMGVNFWCYSGRYQRIAG